MNKSEYKLRPLQIKKYVVPKWLLSLDFQLSDANYRTIHRIHIDRNTRYDSE